MKLRHIVHCAALLLATVATHSHAEEANASAHASDLRASSASAASDGSTGSASRTATPLVPIPPDAGEENTTHKPQTPEPTPVATTTPVSTATPNHDRVINVPSPSPKEGTKAEPVVEPTRAPQPTPSPSEDTAPPVPDPTPTPEPTAGDNLSPNDPTSEPSPTPLPSTSTPTPPPTTGEPESPPPPVAMVPPGLVQPPGKTAEETSLPKTSPVPDPGSPSPPRGPQLHTDPPATDKENRETFTSPDATHNPTASAQSTESTLSPVATVEVTVQDTSSVEKTTPRPKPYRRGDNIIVVQKEFGDGTTVDVEVVVSPAEAPAILVRSATTKSSGSGGHTGSTDASSAFSTLLQTAMSILAFSSLLLLVVFHFIALQPAWTSSMSVLARPNQWELLVFITYIQAMASAAHYVVRNAPASLWNYVDAFSWTVFIPFHHSSSGVSSTSSSTNRRLTDVVVFDGIVAFADRIGVNERDLLQTSAAGLVISSGVVAVLVGVVVTMIKHYSRPAKKDAHGPLTFHSVPGVTSLFRRESSQLPPMYIVYGAIVAFGVFALYPVTLLATFEIASQVRADDISGRSLAIALLLLLAVPMLLIIRSMVALALIHSEDVYKTNWRPRAIWGVLSSSECVKYDQRVPIALAWLAMQLASAIIVGGMVSDVWQLLLLLAVDLVYITVILMIHPFAPGHRLSAIFTCIVAVVKAVNTSIAFTFVDQSSSHSVTATAFIVVNSLVITLWFVRIATIAARVVINVRNPEPLVREHASWSFDGAYESTLFVALPSTRESYQGPRQAML